MSCNILDEYINFSKDCLKKYSRRILKKQFKEDLYDRFERIYFNIRYYNIGKTFSGSFDYSIAMNLREIVIKQKEQSNYNEILNLFKTFKYLLYFDNAKECGSIKKLISELQNFREKELEIENDKSFESEMFDMVKEDLFHKKEFIDRFISKNFKLNFYLTSQDNVYDTTLESTLKFPKLYNQESINKIFNSKEIMEKRLVVEYSYVATQVLMNILKGDFSKDYLVNYVSDLNDKKNISKKVFNVIDNDIAREKIILKVSYEQFLEDRENFYSKMRTGYRFAVIIDESFKFSDTDKEFLEIFKYIIVNSKSIYYNSLKDYNNLIVLR